MEKEMATHSSVLAWRIPGTGEPGGLPSMGLHRVGHDWSDLAAAAAANVSKTGDLLESDYWKTCPSKPWIGGRGRKSWAFPFGQWCHYGDSAPTSANHSVFHFKFLNRETDWLRLGEVSIPAPINHGQNGGFMWFEPAPPHLSLPRNWKVCE